MSVVPQPWPQPAPQLAAQLLDDSWGTRYAARVDTWRMPGATARQHELALAYGRDGHTLLTAVYAAAANDPDLALLARLRQLEVLRVVLVQNYLTVTHEQGREVITRREAEVEVEGLPPGRSRITSPYDTDARWGVKRDTAGLAHDNDGKGHGATATPPHLITNVGDHGRDRARQPDDRADPRPPGPARPAARRAPGRFGLPPAELLASSQADYGITLLTPMLADTPPQARAGAGFERTVHTRQLHQAQLATRAAADTQDFQADTRSAPTSKAPSATAWPSPGCAAVALNLIRLGAW